MATEPVAFVERKREANRRSYAKNAETRRKKNNVRLREKYANDPAWRAKRIAKAVAYQASPAVRRKKSERDYFVSVEKRTGLSKAAYFALLDVQESACAVCRTPFSARPSVDHDHATGKARGLLCVACNTVEGAIRKTGLAPAAYGARMQAYLSDPPAGRLMAQEPAQ